MPKQKKDDILAWASNAGKATDGGPRGSALKRPPRAALTELGLAFLDVQDRALLRTTLGHRALLARASVNQPPGENSLPSPRFLWYTIRHGARSCLYRLLVCAQQEVSLRVDVI